MILINREKLGKATKVESTTGGEARNECLYLFEKEREIVAE